MTEIPTKGQEQDNSNKQASIAAQNPHHWKTLALLSLAQFLVIMDTSIIGVALPAIQQEFSFSQSEVGKLTQQDSY